MLQVLTVHVDTTKAFKDIKAPIQAKFSLLDYLPYILYSLLGLVGSYRIMIWLIVRSAKKKGTLLQLLNSRKLLFRHTCKSIAGSGNTGHEKTLAGRKN